MKRFYVSAAMALLALSLSIPAFSQAGFFATVTGTVTDSSKALVPGVTVKATAVETGVVTSAVTNEAGSYTFNNLLPGKYTVSASLPGFQTKSFTDVQLSQNTSSRYNFELTVSGVNTQVEVQISADTILATSGATVGQALSQQKVQALPIVGNNVLDLITVMAGVEGVIPTNPPSAGNAFGRENTTFAGVSAQNVAIIRDGIQVQDNRYPNGIYSATTINPDLVGEIRLILAPVDVEMGRGNGAITYSTRSGTNKFGGSAVWSNMNTALNPNSWGNNRNQTPIYPGGPVGTPIRPDWSNTNQGTVSFSGPIVRNKTFFFGLFDYYRNDQRTLTNSTVPTACARLGIFRYFNGWNNGNLTTAAVTNAAATAQFPSVKIDGTPINPMNNGANTPGGLPPGWGTGATTGVPYDPSLQAISVFGALPSKPTAADCSDAAVNKTTLIPNGVTPGAPGAPIAPNGSNGWDLYRKQLDPTGFIRRTMDFFPLPNNYEIGDGLNTAGYRFLRHFTGLDNLFGSGEATGRRKQYNAKIDHNFSSNHKANVNLTMERVSSDDVVYSLPGAFSNKNFRNPIVLSSGLTSTLSSTLLNEARFGMRRQGTNVVAPWDRPELQEEMNKYLPPPVNGFRIIPQISALNFCYPHSGVRPPGGCAGGAITAYSIDTTPTYTYADTLSWTRGTHAFKFGAEVRTSSSESKQGTSGFFSNYNISTTAIGGSNGTSSQQTTGATDLASTNPAMPYLLGTSAGTARTLANFYAGSLSDITNLYFITDPNDLSKWSDYKTSPFITTKIIQNEFSTFVKDDYKISKNVTLNLGIRWDYIGVPYVDSGLTVAAVGGGDATFGVSGRDFTGWMNPGERAALTAVQFVGPNSPNKGTTVYPNDYNNFGPGVGFAWNVPWFGEGKTTVRGGYQITFQGGGRFSTIQGALAFPPGSTLQQGSTTNGGNLQNAYLDMTSLATAVPAPPSVLPMQAIPVNQRTQSFTTFDSHYVSPYVENLTMNVTRAVSRNLTMDVRYVGTFSKKNYTTVNLNTPNFLYNGLLGALNAVRSGTETTKTAADPKDLLNKLFDGINLCSAGCTALTGGQTYGAIGTTTGSGATALFQTAAMQMRSSGTFNGALANGYYTNAPLGFTAIAATLNTLNIPAGGGNPAPLTGLGGVLRRANTLYPGQFPENFIATNPQYAAMNLYTNSGYNNYHSLEVQASVRPIHGFSGQATYTWSKNLGLPTTLTDPTNRAADYTNINGTPGHSLRTNTVVELPFGPNKLVLGNSSGWLARAVERWQLGLIYNLNSGAPTTITAANQLYANGVPDIVYPVDFNKLKGVRWGIRNGVFEEGRYFDNNDTFLKVADPQCSAVTNAQNLSGLVPATGVGTLRCTLQALAMAVPAGTAGATDRVFNDGVTRPSVIVLQNPQPGKRGTLGQNSVIGLGSFRFDANLGKTFRITESKNVQVRFDALNVLNHPQPATPSFAVNSTAPWGQITAPFGTNNAKSGNRLFQGQLRFTF